MKKKVAGITIAAVTYALFSSIAVAQNLEEVTVQGTRIINTQEVRAPLTVPVNEVSLSYGVSTAGLDLASKAGMMEAEKRVKDVADAACRELGKLYPKSSPNDAECAKAAAQEAMVKLRQLAAAGRKTSSK